MPIIKLVDPDGAAKQVTASAGVSVMEAAIANNISQIEAECGGAMACATCHVYVADAWVGKIQAKTEFEADMLEMAEDEVREGSRLSCQISMSDVLDGIVIQLPGA